MSQMSKIKPQVIDRHMGGQLNPFWRGKKRFLRGSDFSYKPRTIAKY